LPWTRPSIWVLISERLKASLSWASSWASLSSEISGTVGLERPREIGAWVRGVFWGVGAVMLAEEMGTLDDILMNFYGFREKKELAIADKAICRYLRSRCSPGPRGGVPIIKSHGLGDDVFCSTGFEP
jgi:hypothetical protein